MGKGQGGIFPRAPAWSRSLSIPSLPHPVTNRRIGRDLALCFGALSRSLSGIAPSKQESTTYEPSLVCKLLILGCRLLIPDRLLELGKCSTVFGRKD